MSEILMQGTPGLVAATGMSGEAGKGLEHGADPKEGTQVRMRPLHRDHAECSSNTSNNKTYLLT